MKIFFKCLINLFFILTLLIPSKSFATITDSASILTGKEFSELSGHIQQIEHKHGIKIEIVTQPTIHAKKIKEESKRLINRMTELPNSGENGNFLLLIVMDTRQYNAIADQKLEARLFDLNDNPKFNESKFLNALKKDDYVSGLTSYVDEIDSTLSNYPAAENNSNEFFDPFAAMIAIVGGIVIGFMYRSSLIASMSNVKPAIEASEYLDKENIKIIENRDNFLYTNISRRPKSQSSHGGGGNNGGGGHGGSF